MKTSVLFNKDLFNKEYAEISQLNSMLGLKRVEITIENDLGSEYELYKYGTLMIRDDAREGYKVGIVIRGGNTYVKHVVFPFDRCAHIEQLYITYVGIGTAEFYSSSAINGKYGVYADRVRVKDLHVSGQTYGTPFKADNIYMDLDKETDRHTFSVYRTYASIIEVPRNIIVIDADSHAGNVNYIPALKNMAGAFKEYIIKNDYIELLGFNSRRKIRFEDLPEEVFAGIREYYKTRIDSDIKFV